MSLSLRLSQFVSFSPHDDLQHNKQGLMKGASQGNRNSPSRGLNQKQQTKVTAGLHLSRVHLLNRVTKCGAVCTNVNVI